MRPSARHDGVGCGFGHVQEQHVVRQCERDTGAFGGIGPRRPLDQSIEEIAPGLGRRTVKTLALFEVRGGDGWKHQLQISLHLHADGQHLIELVRGCQLPECLYADPSGDVVDGQDRR